MNQPTAAARPGYQRPRRARIMNAVNVIMRLVLRLPFPTPLSGSLMLLSLTGRKTGRAYRQPVSYVRVGAVLLTPGGGRWKLNVREGQPVHVRLRGRDIWVRPEFIRDADEVEQTLRRMVAINPRVASFMPIIGRRGEVDRTSLQDALSHGFRIIRWRLDEAAPGQDRIGARGQS
jgi:deazaflavin-dependent oxidoreductase (nitroreductase family)